MQPQMNPTAIDIRGVIRPEYESILTADAVDFLAGLARQFSARRDELLAAREARQAAIRDDSSWRVAPVPLLWPCEFDMISTTGPGIYGHD